jgi:SSS family solute:Na+ symporter
MHPVDVAIIVAYFLLMIGVGWWVAKRAARDSESYFLAGKSLPWWIIGVAHGSSGIDIAGTMWFTAMLFIYGAKGLWLLWVWPLFNVVFRMVYLGTWVRRSNVLTGAEWMKTRFGTGRGAELAYLSVVLYALVSVVGFQTMAFQGIGKFAEPFFGWGWSANSYALLIMLVSGIYCVVGGMYSVVLNDLIQFVLILVAAVIIAAVAIAKTSPEQIAALVPAGWDRLFFGWHLELDWSGLLPALQERVHGPGGDGYAVFGFFVAMLFLKGVLVSMAGPTPNYAIQHVLSTRSPKEAALENLMMALCSLAPRFLLIAGLAVLGIVFYSADLKGMGAKVDFEKILPGVVSDHLPIGARGIILAGLLAAFMSTLVSTVNSGVAYIVNDIHKRYFRPDLGSRESVRLGYFWSVIVLLVGIAFGYLTLNVHSVTRWLTSALVPAFVIPNVLKWHWWRFNAHGFWAGMAGGILGALLVPLAFPTLRDVWLFLSILGLSAAASVVACLLTAPEPDDVLKRFYRTIRPWGFWGPVLAKCRAETPGLQPNREAARDGFNVLVGILWQVAMVAAPIYLVLQNGPRTLLWTAVFVVTSVVLKFTWYDRLGSGDGHADPNR